MQEVCLLGLEQAGVIVPCKTGVVYWSYVGRSAERYEQEGFFVPISNDPLDDSPEQLLAPRLSRSGSTGSALSMGQVQDIDHLLLEVSSSDHFRVDRTRLQQSLPGWLAVVIEAQGEFSYFHQAGPIEATLVWPLKG